MLDATKPETLLEVNNIEVQNDDVESDFKLAAF